MPEAQLNGVSYFYEVAEADGHALNQGKRPLLILLHGFTGSSQNWQPLLPALTSHCNLLIPDILGHGRSASPPDPKRYHMAQVAADIIALLDQLTDEPAHLLGYSMGGRLALYLAVRYPARFKSLILESASPGLKSETERAERRQRDNTLANRIEQEGIAAFVEFWESLPLWASQAQLSPEIRARLRRQRLENDPTGLANSLRGMGTGVQPSLWQNLPEVNFPVLLLTGALDHKFVGIGEDMASRFTQAQHVIVPNAGHTIHLEQPDDYVQMVFSFFTAKNLADAEGRD